MAGALVQNRLRAEADELEGTRSLLDAIDLQRVGEGPDAWTVHVFGAHFDGRDMWVQVASSPEGADAFVLRLSAHARARHALAALAALSGTRVIPPVVSVMCTVG